jgi:hypothetical protein
MQHIDVDGGVNELLTGAKFTRPHENLFGKEAGITLYNSCINKDRFNYGKCRLAVVRLCEKSRDLAPLHSFAKQCFEGTGGAHWHRHLVFKSLVAYVACRIDISPFLEYPSDPDLHKTVARLRELVERNSWGKDFNKHLSVRRGHYDTFISAIRIALAELLVWPQLADPSSSLPGANDPPQPSKEQLEKVACLHRLFGHIFLCPATLIEVLRNTHISARTLLELCSDKELEKGVHRQIYKKGFTGARGFILKYTQGGGENREARALPSDLFSKDRAFAKKLQSLTDARKRQLRELLLIG